MSEMDNNKILNNKNKILKKKNSLSKSSQSLAVSRKGLRNKTLNENIFNQKDHDMETYSGKKINHLYHLISLIQNNYAHGKRSIQLKKAITLLEIMEVKLTRLELDKLLIDENLYQEKYNDIIERNLPKIRKYLENTQTSLLLKEQLDRELAIMFYDVFIMIAEVSKVVATGTFTVLAAPLVLTTGATGAVAAMATAGLIGANAVAQEVATQGGEMYGSRKEFDLWKAGRIGIKTFIEAFLVGTVLKLVIPIGTTQAIIDELVKRLCVNVMLRTAIVTLLNMNDDPYKKQMDRLIKDTTIKGIILSVLSSIIKAK